LNGLEVNKFIPVVTVKQRVQFGIDGRRVRRDDGDGRTADTAQRLRGCSQCARPGHRTTVVTTIESTIVDAKQLMVFDPTLLGRVEFAVAAILAPQLKVRFSLGMNFPGSQVASVGASYFFGRN
jgi:hypothetical protein